MLETNIRIVPPGNSIYVWTRRATVTGTHFTPDLLEKCCGKLRYWHGLAAVIHPTKSASLLVASTHPIKPVHLEDEEWELDVADAGDPSYRYTLNDQHGKDILPRLLERALLVTVKSQRALWNYDSPRIWYEKNPIKVSGGFAAYQRFEITGLYIEDVGVGIAVDIGTAFFTEKNLEYYFANNIPVLEQKKRQSEFDDFRKRQGDYAGTLLYDFGDGYSKCYFVTSNGQTCATPAKVKVKGKTTYNSLSEYYKHEKPAVRFTDETPAIQVRFAQLSHPRPVAANCLRLRVMNDVLPNNLRDIDKVNPQTRREEILHFWKSLGSKPFGSVATSMPNEDLWRPTERYQRLFALPDLIFGQDQYLMSPQERSAKAYKSYFRKRMDYLDKFGSYIVPPMMSRKLYCAYPENLRAEIAIFCGDLSTYISKWTGNSVQVEPLPYKEVKQVVADLQKKSDSGLVVFILNEESNAYYEVAFLLAQWRIKRITQNEIERHYELRKNGAWDNFSNKVTLARGKMRWDGFVKMNGLEVLQLLDTVPYRNVQAGRYDAQIIIDVSHDYSYFALSLLINRELVKSPSFFLRTEPYRKADHKHQTINPTILADEIERMFDNMREQYENFDPLESILFMRDGKYYGTTIDNEYRHETDGVYDVINRLRTKEILAKNGSADLVNLHKDSLSGIRFWTIDNNNVADNPLEGQAVLLGPITLAVSTTGQGTLTNGTAQPFILQSSNQISDIMQMGESTILSSQLNWSSPTVAQRLPIQAKRADEILIYRTNQEVRSPK